MYHRLHFRAKRELVVLHSGEERLGRMIIYKGAVIEAEVQPYVMKTTEGPVETADLHLPEEATLLKVPMKYFSFA